MAENSETGLPWPVCRILLLVATPAEGDALSEQAGELKLPFGKEKALTKHFRDHGLRDDIWTLGAIGGETVLAVGCSRLAGRPVMGPHGRLGSAARGVRYLAATGAQGIIQVGMAFGISRGHQQIGDVLISTSLAPYDQRDVKPSPNPPGYVNDYTTVRTEPARPSLVERCRREAGRTTFEFGVQFGALLSGSARIHSAAFRDELYRTVPHGNDPIVGGEMEGVGLLAAAVKADDPVWPVWCVVKGISDFADEQRDEEIVTGRPLAARNAARFVLSGLVNDAAMLTRQEGP